MSQSKPPPKRPSKLPPRLTRRPTVAINSFGPHRIQEVLIAIFNKYDHKPIDIQALIYFALQSFEVSPLGYETMHGIVRAHILANFAIHQGSLLRQGEVNIRRVTVCYTIEKNKE